jgi:hypothetical protein
MKRNLIALGCAALLAFGLSFGTFAGSQPDTDGDGVPDTWDNCLTMPNGPLGAPTFPLNSLCAQQDDGGPGGLPDGYGNACDYDIDDNNAVTLADLSDMQNLIGNNAALFADFDCNGAITLGDLSAMQARIGPIGLGPSGLACAGGGPVCVAP